MAIRMAKVVIRNLTRDKKKVFSSSSKTVSLIEIRTVAF